jgi:hypothetical protein
MFLINLICDTFIAIKGNPSTCALFQQVDYKKWHNKPALVCLIACIRANTYPMAAASGFNQSPGPTSMGHMV